MEFELEDEEKESKIVVHDVVQKDIGRLSCRFQDLDLVEFQNVLKGGLRNSKQSKTWVENAFKEFHKHCGYCTNLDIDDLSKKKDLVPFVDVLVIFMF